MDDFKRLEQACNNDGSQPHHQVRNPRKKKLFDDSDSDRDNEPQELDQNDLGGADVSRRPQQASSGASRSNLVKKMFYKD